jgi:hypothetical protein
MDALYEQKTLNDPRGPGAALVGQALLKAARIAWSCQGFRRGLCVGPSISGV